MLQKKTLFQSELLMNIIGEYGWIQGGARSSEVTVWSTVSAHLHEYMLSYDVNGFTLFYT